MVRIQTMLFLSILCFYGCSTVEPAPHSSAAHANYFQGMIKYSSTPCYGECPVVDVFLFPDGEIVFRGERLDFQWLESNDTTQQFVYSHDRAAANSYEELLKYLIEQEIGDLHDVYAAPDVCGQMATDHETKVLQIDDSRVNKRIFYNLGCWDSPDEAKLNAIFERVEKSLMVNKLIERELTD